MSHRAKCRIIQHIPNTQTSRGEEMMLCNRVCVWVGGGDEAVGGKGAVGWDRGVREGKERDTTIACGVCDEIRWD